MCGVLEREERRWCKECAVAGVYYYVVCCILCYLFFILLK